VQPFLKEIREKTQSPVVYESGKSFSKSKTGKARLHRSERGLRNAEVDEKQRPRRQRRARPVSDATRAGSPRTRSMMNLDFPGAARLFVGMLWPQLLSLSWAIPRARTASRITTKRPISSSRKTRVAFVAPTVCAACIRAHMDFLASDALRGRGSATPDELVAATYVGAVLEPVRNHTRR